MPEALYGELDASAEADFNRHIEGCTACAALYRELRGTLEIMSRRHRPDPGAPFWDGYWQRLQERAAGEADIVDASRLARRRSIGSWGFRAAAAVVVLAGGVWIGRTVLAPHAPATEPAPQTAAVTPQDGGQTQPQDATRPDLAIPTGDDAHELAARPQPIDAPPGEAPVERAAPHANGAGVVTAASGGDDEALRYIGRSQVVLLALLNGGGDGETGDYRSERAQARVLVAEGQKVQDDLTRPRDRRLRELVSQLEMILREIANMEADDDLDAVEMIRNRVDREGVLLRIDLQQLREASAPDKEQGRAGKAFD
jgi:hypothetical protein